MSAADQALLALLLAEYVPPRWACATCDACWQGWCLTIASPAYLRQVSPGERCGVWAPVHPDYPRPHRVVERQLMEEAHAAERLRLASW